MRKSAYTNFFKAYAWYKWRDTKAIEQTWGCTMSMSARRVLIGGPAQDFTNFQMVSIPILSVLTCSTGSPHDILKVKKMTITFSLGRPNMAIVFQVGLDFGGFLTRFDLICNSAAVSSEILVRLL